MKLLITEIDQNNQYINSEVHGEYTPGASLKLAIMELMDMDELPMLSQLDTYSREDDEITLIDSNTQITYHFQFTGNDQKIKLSYTEDIFEDVNTRKAFIQIMNEHASDVIRDLRCSL